MIICAVVMSEENKNITAPSPPGRHAEKEKWFEDIYNLYWKKLYEYCYYHTRDPGASEEMIQDIFYALWVRRETLDLRAPVDHYLIRAAKNKIADYYRLKSLYHKHTENAQRQLQWDNTTDNAVHFRELSDSITELVDGLPHQRRQVYKLSREQGLSNKEIAASMLISEKTVEFHLTKTLAFLRRKLASYGF